jgi:hypothetical protein
MTNGRTSTATLIDFEGLLKTAKANEVVQEGLRRVENLLVFTDDYTQGLADNSGNTATANNVNFTVAASYRYKFCQTLEPGTYVFSVKVRSLDGKSSIGVRAYDSTATETTVQKSVVLTANYQRISLIATITAADTFRFGLDNRIAQGGDASTIGTIDIINWQVEKVTGQVNQNASEYVSSAVTYNAGIPGVKYFNTLNGNTVAANVVTEATGAPISYSGGIRHEGAATNLCINAEDWGTGRTLVASTIATNSTAAPTGAATADKIVEDSTNAIHLAASTAIDVTTGINYTHSSFVKAGERSSLIIYFSGLGGWTGATGAKALADLTANTITWLSGAGLDKKIEQLSNGYYRISTTANRTGATAPTQAGNELYNGTETYTGNGASGLFIFGQQVEVGLYRTSYIPTTTAAVTRAIDSNKIPLSAEVNIKQDKGICFFKIRPQFANSATAKSILCTNTAATDFIGDNGSGGITLNDGTNTATAAVGGWSVNDTLLGAAVWGDSLMSISVSKNGGAWIDSTDTTYDGSFPIGANLLLANASTDTILFDAVKIKKITKTFTDSKAWAKANALSEAV